MPNYNKWRPQKNNADRGNRDQAGARQAEAKPPVDVPAVICPYCNQPIYDMSAAIEHRESGEPAHFDCVVDRIYKSESLEAKEQVLYMGSGVFAIVEYDERVRNRFTIKRKIEWETKDERKEWRQKLQKRIG